MSALDTVKSGLLVEMARRGIRNPASMSAVQVQGALAMATVAAAPAVIGPDRGIWYVRDDLAEAWGRSQDAGEVGGTAPE